MKPRPSGTRWLTLQAMLAALYAALTLLLQPISFGPVQCRISEALTLLPSLLPDTAWGLTVGCFLANLIGGGGLPDLIFGTLATALAAFLTGRCRKKLWAAVPPVLCNAVLIGIVLSRLYTPDAFWESLPLTMLQVAGGELLAVLGGGLPLLALAERKGWTEKWGSAPKTRKTGDSTKQGGKS